jgi:hypothetical protein
VRAIDEIVPEKHGGLVTFGGPPIPIPPEMNDSAFRRTVGGRPPTPLGAGIRETIERFTALRDENRLFAGDLD